MPQYLILSRLLKFSKPAQQLTNRIENFFIPVEQQKFKIQEM